jgi:glc operon protein GlcG
MDNAYGLSITLADAKKVAAAAIAEAVKNSWKMAVAIVDTGAHLVYYEKMDNTQIGSAQVSVDKARSAVLFKRPTRLFQEMLASGDDGLRVFGLNGAVPVEGGLPLLQDGRIVGAIGLSGGTSPQDGQCAQAGAAALK